MGIQMLGFIKKKNYTLKTGTVMFPKVNYDFNNYTDL